MQQVVVPKSKHYSAESEEAQRWRGRGEGDGSPGRSPGGKRVKGEIAWYVQTLAFQHKSFPLALAFSLGSIVPNQSGNEMEKWIKKTSKDTNKTKTTLEIVDCRYDMLRFK